MAAATVRLLHPRVGLGLFGGSPVLGSASTLGMRIGSRPRVSLSFRGVLVPVDLVTPLLDRDAGAPDNPGDLVGVVRDGERRRLPGLAGQATIGVFGGWSPGATVGGVGSLDALVRVSWLELPGDAFDGGVTGVSAAFRLGLLRESFTMPGISITGGYGRSTSFTFGQPGEDDGFVRGAVGNWKATAAASRRVGPVGLTAGVAYDRYTGDVRFSYFGASGTRESDATTDRWSAYGDVSYTHLVYHFSVEGGWQAAPYPEGLAESVRLDPVSWWIAAAFRLSI